MSRLVLDTNILVAAAYNRGSASFRIVRRCASGELEMVVSPAVRGEYEAILPRAVKNPHELKSLWSIIDQAACVEPRTTPRVVPEDPEDDKFVAAAQAGNAEALITNDDHLLSLGDSVMGLAILRPGEFERRRHES